MAYHTATIYDFVSAEVAQGKVIDIDQYCQKFMSLFPELAWVQLQTEVLEAVGEYGGGAVWGTKQAIASSMHSSDEG